MSLFAELKRRNVFRVGAAYVALGWIVTQVTATVAPMLNLPAWLPPVVFWIGLAGFPFVLLFSWVYELTPEGLKRESEIDRTRSISHLTARRLDLIVIAMLAVAMLLFLADRFVPRGAAVADGAGEGLAGDASAAGDRAQGALPRQGSADPGQGVLPPEPASAPDPRSIAVLPFVNMSSDTEQEYFSDGISEELLNLLAKIPELRVIARTSSFAYKGKEAKIADVARELNVAHVLEGSVRKSASKVRITAQLVRGADSTHLWSETYDRSLDDIFAVQDEIAAAVVSQLKVTLLGAAPKTRVVKPEAYALFLQARQLGRQFSPEGFRRSTSLYEQAVAIDPAYPEAWRNMAANYMNEAGFGMRPNDEAYWKSRAAIERALAIDPGYARAYDGLAWRAMTFEWDLPAAARHWKHALKLEPTNVDILGNASNLLVRLGRVDRAIEVCRFVTERDPLDALGRSTLAGFYLIAGRFDEAVAMGRAVLELSPGFLGAQLTIAEARLRKGEAAAALEAINAETDELSRMFGLVEVHHAQARAAESDAALAAFVARFGAQQPFSVALLHGYRGETEAAFDWLQKAERARDPGLSAVLTSWQLADLQGDPRWPALLERTGMSPAQLATIDFDVELPE